MGMVRPSTILPVPRKGFHASTFTGDWLFYSQGDEMATIQIKNRYTDEVLFECEAPADLNSGLHTRYALEKATQAGAYLAGAYLAGAYLAGAYLDGAKLIGKRPVFQIGPIGSRCAYFVSSITDQGIKLRAGCFFGTVDEFVSKLSEEHGDNEHAIEYRAALELIKAHAEIWTPKES